MTDQTDMMAQALMSQDQNQAMNQQQQLGGITGMMGDPSQVQLGGWDTGAKPPVAPSEKRLMNPFGGALGQLGQGFLQKLLQGGGQGLMGLMNPTAPPGGPAAQPPGIAAPPGGQVQQPQILPHY